jgi:hypothetical protein
MRLTNVLLEKGRQTLQSPFKNLRTIYCFNGRKAKFGLERADGQTSAFIEG